MYSFIEAGKRLRVLALIGFAAGGVLLSREETLSVESHPAPLPPPVEAPAQNFADQLLPWALLVVGVIASGALAARLRPRRQEVRQQGRAVETISLDVETPVAEDEFGQSLWGEYRRASVDKYNAQARVDAALDYLRETLILNGFKKSR